jgi:hypothetical protein
MASETFGYGTCVSFFPSTPFGDPRAENPGRMRALYGTLIVEEL